MLFVAHDLAVVRQIADYILIMYAGHILEAAPGREIYANACHPYTQVLLESAPSISKGVRGEAFHLNLKIGDAPDPHQVRVCGRGMQTEGSKGAEGFRRPLCGLRQI